MQIEKDGITITLIKYQSEKERKIFYMIIQAAP